MTDTQAPSKKLISDERLRRLRADWAQADETGSYPGVIESSEVLLVCDELIASRAAHEPPAVPVEIARLNRRVADLERVEKLQQQVINDLCQRAAQPPGSDHEEAERYRWLRVLANFDHVNTLLDRVDITNLDAAIDVARASATKPGDQA